MTPRLVGFASVVLGLLVLLAFPAAARAEPGKTLEEWRALDATVVSLRNVGSTKADGSFSSAISVQVLDAALAPNGKATAVYDGAFRFARLAVRPGGAAVLMFGGESPKVQVALVDLAKGTTKLVELPRTAPKGYSPTAAVACPDDDGFTLLWQETAADPNDVHSTLARVKADGTVLLAPKSVPIVWGLGAIVATPGGYTLAVRYDGAAIDQTRICFVTLDAGGAPQQHPWWGTRPARVGDVQLLATAGEVRVIYRAGAAASGSILASTVTPGQWGVEAQASEVLVGSLAAGPFAVRRKKGALDVAHR